LYERWQAAVAGSGHVIPTLADGNRFHFSEKLRAETRQELGFTDGQPVFVFSGTLSSYQGFAAAMGIFQSALAREPNARLLLLTPDVGQGKASLAQLRANQFMVRAVAFDEMNRMLNAADFAFLTRPPSAINRAAFPTKFAEYGLAGLPIIMSEATPDCIVHAQSAGNYVSMRSSEALLPLNDMQRQAVSVYFQSALTHASFRVQYADIYAMPGAAEERMRASCP
jgi:hypothetical protein